MNDRFSSNHLRRLRNEIPISTLIADVFKIPSKVADGYFRFLCPICSEFITATNPKTNLARCFRCEKNFNPIDMAMTVKHYGFREAVEYLDSLMNGNSIP